MIVHQATKKQVLCIPAEVVNMSRCFPSCRYHVAVAHPAFKVTEKLKVKPPQSQLWPQPPPPQWSWVLDSHPFHCLCEVIQLYLLTTVTTCTTHYTTIDV